MHTIPGYTISEILDDQQSVLLRATRGGRRVLLRTRPKGPLTSEEQSRVRYGCKLSEELEKDPEKAAKMMAEFGEKKMAMETRMEQLEKDAPGIKDHAGLKAAMAGFVD